MSGVSSSAPLPPAQQSGVAAEVTEKQREHRDGKPKYGPLAAIAVAVGAFFAAQLLVGLAIGLLPAMLGWDVGRVDAWLRGSVLAQFLTILMVEVVLLWLIWQFMRSRRISLKEIGLIKPEYRDISYAIIGYIVYFALLLMLTAVVRDVFPGIDFEQEQEIGFSRSASGHALWLVFASLVILPPVTEEIVCRGFLYTGLRNKLPVISAAIITSVIFALAHLQWGSGNALLWAAAVDTFVLSMVLVYLREKTGSIWSPVLVHMMKNGLAFTILFVYRL